MVVIFQHVIQTLKIEHPEIIESSCVRIMLGVTIQRVQLQDAPALKLPLELKYKG